MSYFPSTKRAVPLMQKTFWADFNRNIMADALLVFAAFQLASVLLCRLLRNNVAIAAIMIMIANAAAIT